MASKQQKIEHLGDHLPYEVLMLRYTHSRMNSPRYPLAWNAFYEAFAVHARNLLDFLENKAGSSNFQASHFSDTFEVKEDKENKEIGRVVRQEMNWQVFHFVKSRSSKQSEKVDLEKVNRVHKWVMDNFSRFILELNADLKEHWYPDRADPDKFYELYQKKMGEVTELFLKIQNQTTSTADPQERWSNQSRKR
jgi:hypothetical protein